MTTNVLRVRAALALCGGGKKLLACSLDYIAMGVRTHSKHPKKSSSRADVTTILVLVGCPSVGVSTWQHVDAAACANGTSALKGNTTPHTPDSYVADYAPSSRAHRAGAAGRRRRRLLLGNYPGGGRLGD